MFARAGDAAALTAPGPEDLGWKAHLIRKGDGSGGWMYCNAEYRFLHKPGGKYLMPLMNNGEVLFAGSWHDGSVGRRH